MKPLHFGSFGGPLVQIVWATAGLAPPVLFLSGVIMWWNRSRAASRRTGVRPRAPEPAWSSRIRGSRLYLRLLSRDWR
jgi:uncharacterized iron-regulated membrane protein